MPDSNDSERPDAAESPPVVVDFQVLRKVAGLNFRDIGGHPASRRRRVRRGRVFRSSHLAELPESSPLKTLPLKTLVTLQSRIEVRHLGPPEPAARDGVRWEHIPIGDTWFTSEGFTRIDAEPGRVHLALVVQFRNDWQRFFKLLAERDVYPLLFHCSAGRDRTGVGAAMLLSVLGVDRGRILEDFLASNAVFTATPLTPEELEPLFELIDECGGVDAFMQDQIGVTAAELDAIRADLLED